MGLTAYIFVVFLMFVGTAVYFSQRLAKTNERHKPSNAQKKTCICIFIAETIWFAVFLFGIWYTLGLPEAGFYAVCFVVIIPSIAYPIYLFFKRKTFLIATLSLIMGILFLILLGLLMLISTM